MRQVIIQNPTPLKSPYTIISTDYTSGTSLLVEDSTSFKDNDLILVGGLGNEKAETTDLTATPPSESALTITSLGHAHSTDESVQGILWDKYEVEYKVDSTSDWIVLATAQGFDWSANETIYKHDAGLSSYYYRVRYYNSATTQNSDYTGTISGIGSTRTSVGSMVEQVRKNAKDENEQKVSDELIISYFNFAQDIVKSLNKKWPWLQAEATINPTTLALPSDFKRAYRLKYNYVSGTTSNTYYLTYLPLPDFQNKYFDNNADEDDDLVNYSIDTVNEVVKLGPTPETNTAILTLVYEKDITDLEDWDDVTVIPLPELLIAYATAKVFKLKSNQDEYTSWMTDFSDLLQVLDQARPVSYHPRTLKRFTSRGPYSNYVLDMDSGVPSDNDDD